MTANQRYKSYKDDGGTLSFTQWAEQELPPREHYMGFNAEGTKFTIMGMAPWKFAAAIALSTAAVVLIIRAVTKKNES